MHGTIAEQFKLKAPALAADSALYVRLAADLHETRDAIQTARRIAKKILDEKNLDQLIAAILGCAKVVSADMEAERQRNGVGQRGQADDGQKNIAHSTQPLSAVQSECVQSDQSKLDRRDQKPQKSVAKEGRGWGVLSLGSGRSKGTVPESKLPPRIGLVKATGFIWDNIEARLDPLDIDLDFTIFEARQQIDQRKKKIKAVSKSVRVLMALVECAKAVAHEDDKATFREVLKPSQIENVLRKEDLADAA
jgi:hypothetical protein